MPTRAQLSTTPQPGPAGTPPPAGPEPFGRAAEAADAWASGWLLRAEDRHGIPAAHGAAARAFASPMLPDHSPARPVPRDPAPQPLPVATTIPDAITCTSAVLGGMALADEPVAERGIVYSASVPVPALGNSNKVRIGHGPGRFAQSVSLSSDTAYFVRAYVITAAGPAYGAAVAFKTLAQLVAAVSIRQPASRRNGATAAVVATGGSAPYTYSWRNTSICITLAPTGAVATDLGPGSYTATVTDCTGATTTASILIL